MIGGSSVADYNGALSLASTTMGTITSPGIGGIRREMAALDRHGSRQIAIPVAEERWVVGLS